MCTVCIFLACKVEEYPLSTNDLVNVVDILISKPFISIGGCSNMNKNIKWNKAVWNPLIGSHYYKIKTNLLFDERELLKRIAWEVNTISDNEILYEMSTATFKIYSITSIALSLMNDIMIFSTALLHLSLENIILACLVYAKDVVHTRCISPEIDIKNLTLKKWKLNCYSSLDSFFEYIVQKLNCKEFGCFYKETQEAIVCLRNLSHK
jgi:hypothetical protein